MKRLVHSQQGIGALLIDDIDDGLPNKTAHRLGSSGDPNAAIRDGYANQPKQGTYVPYAKKTDTSIPGYLDLQETTRVTLSVEKGKIAGFLRAGKLSVVDLVAADLTAPTLASGTRNSPGAGDLSLSGTGFLSVTPDITQVILSGAGVGSKTLTAAQIITASGSVGATAIVILASLLTGLAAGDKVQVKANGALTAIITLT
jgi:hypothetical protein